MDRRRLRIVDDICPLPAHPPLSFDGTAWASTVAASIVPIIPHANGYTATILQNRLITWHRTFTVDDVPPEPLPLPKSSFLHVHEWGPDIWPRNHNGWRYFSAPNCHAIALLNATTDYHKVWSSHARRHLSTFKKSGATLRVGTPEEAAAHCRPSQVPKHLQEVFLRLMHKHLATHPNDIEVLLAEHQGKVIGGFVAANCDAIKQSSYLFGFFHPNAAKLQPMTGLIDWWFTRSLERGYVSVTFGDIVPPHSLPFDSALGYSNFKTHFGIRRVWLPGSFWKISRATTVRP